MAPGFPVEVFNTLGAGDAFMAGFLRGWLRGEPLERCCRYANACGAIVVSRHGCAPAMPTWAELEHFLATGVDDAAPARGCASSSTSTAPPRAARFPQRSQVLAFDHRGHFEALARAHGAGAARIAAFKALVADAFERVAPRASRRRRRARRPLRRRRSSRASPARATGSRARWKLPNTVPLAFERGDRTRARAAHLARRARREVPRVLQRRRSRGAAQAQHREPARPSRDACAATGRELLLEVIPPPQALHDALAIAARARGDLRRRHPPRLVEAAAHARASAAWNARGRGRSSAHDPLVPRRAGARHGIGRRATCAAASTAAAALPARARLRRRPLDLRAAPPQDWFAGRAHRRSRWSTPSPRATRKSSRSGMPRRRPRRAPRRTTQGEGMSNPRIGFIGVGMMGHGMAKNLLAKGFPLTLRINRDRAKAADLLAAGAKEAKTPAEVARESDFVIICVTGSPQVEEVILGADGILEAARRGPHGDRDLHRGARLHREGPRGARRQGRHARRCPARAHAQGSRGRPPQHDGGRERRRLRQGEAGARRLLREHLPRRARPAPATR